MIVGASYLQAIIQQSKTDNSFRISKKVNPSQLATTQSNLNLQTETKAVRSQPNIDNHHWELLDFYKKRYESLPPNLGRVQRRMAISQIRQETAKRYSLTLTEFNRIREAYKVTFWQAIQMTSEKEFRFAEVLVDRLFLESFSNEQSAYNTGLERKLDARKRQKLLTRLKWHINNSLSKRQKEVVKFYLSGKKEREIAVILGVTQQVVNIYKQRAIKKLVKAMGH